jgi:nicotinamidase-related amidase
MSRSTALLVIDVQADMFSPDYPAYDGERLIACIGSLIAGARAASIPVIYVQHCDREGSTMAYGTPGWEIHPAIAPLAGDTVLQKRMPDAFHDTTLQQELEARKIERLVVVGLQTEMCVDTTCRRAFSLGYEVILASDGHGTWDNDLLTAQQIIAHHNTTLSPWFVTLQPASEIRFAEPDHDIGIA